MNKWGLKLSLVAFAASLIVTQGSSAAPAGAGAAVVTGGQFFDGGCPPVQPGLRFNFTGRMPAGRTFYQVSGKGRSIWDCTFYKPLTLTGSSVAGKTFEWSCVGHASYITTGIYLDMPDYHPVVPPGFFFLATCRTVGIPGTFRLALAFQGTTYDGECCWRFKHIVGTIATFLKPAVG